MKRKKCPYCSKRVGYISLYSSRRKGQYVCKECGKESKVIINKSIFIGFAVAVLIAVAIMICWVSLGLISNPLGIVLVAAPLVIFALASPTSVYHEPLKKYKKSMEAKKAGIEYSDSLTSGEIDSTEWTGTIPRVEDTGTFSVNSELFNAIRDKKNAERVRSNTAVFEPVSADIEEAQTESAEEMVPVINNVSENHSSSSDIPLRKIRHEVRSAPSRARHYIATEEASESDDSDVKSYSGNRRF